jgi:predicted metal-binding protein
MGIGHDSPVGYSCLAHAKPGCPYNSAEEMAEILKNKTGIEVVQGTHDYH